jgi:hypothetical protein
MAVNPHFLSEMDETPTNQIRDDLDFPHSGIFKALHLATKGTYIIKESATDFDITQTTDSSVTRLQVKGGAGFRQGKYVQIGSGSGTTTNINLSASYNPGTGAVDITPDASSDVYLFLVAKADNSIVLRGVNTNTDKVPELVADDIPIAVIKSVGGTDNDATDRPIQYLTTDLDDHSLSIGYASSDNYVEAMSITSDTSGEVTIENTVSNQDMIFKVNDATTSTEVMRFDAAIASVIFNNGGLTTVDFKVKSDSYDIISVDSSDNSISIGGHDSAKIGFYAASAIVTPVLDLAVMTAGSPTPSVAELDAKILAVANVLSNLGLVNVA